MDSGARRWCYTLNNYTDADVVKARDVDSRYHVFGKETGESGTKHLQGAITFTKLYKLSGVKKIFVTAHWEKMKGTLLQAATYCKKDGDFEEFGDAPSEDGGAANKKRWSEAVECAKAGDFDNIPADIFFKYYRTCKELAKDNMPKPPDADGTTGVWIYGPAGVGKSRLARQDYPDAYFKMQNKWWDGYQNEENVILDDFDCKELGHHLKIWADRYSFVGENKGGAIHIRPKTFVVTSNYSIEELFPEEELGAAVRRRFKVIHISTPHTFSVL